MKCEVCGNVLQTLDEGSKTAEYCASCGNYQDWRRHLFQWSGLAAACIALLPLFNGAHSLYEIANPPDAEIRIVEAFCRSSDVRVFVENTGGRGAHVYSPSFSVKDDGGTRELALQSLAGDFSTEVDPGRLERLDFSLAPPQRMPSRSGQRACEIKVTFSLVGPENHAPVVGSCSCPV